MINAFRDSDSIWLDRLTREAERHDRNEEL